MHRVVTLNTRRRQPDLRVQERPWRKTKTRCNDRPQWSTHRVHSGKAVRPSRTPTSNSRTSQMTRLSTGTLSFLFVAGCFSANPQAEGDGTAGNDTSGDGTSDMDPAATADSPVDDPDSTTGTPEGDGQTTGDGDSGVGTSESAEETGDSGAETGDSETGTGDPGTDTGDPGSESGDPPQPAAGTAPSRKAKSAITAPSRLTTRTAIATPASVCSTASTMCAVIASCSRGRRNATSVRPPLEGPTEFATRAALSTAR